MSTGGAVPNAFWKRPAGDVRLLVRLIALARPYKLHLPAILGLNLLSVPLTLLAPVPLALAVDSVIGSKPLPGFIAWIAPDSIERSTGGLLAFTVVLLLLVALLLQLQDVARSVLTTYTGERMQLDLRTRLFDHAQRLSLTYHDSTGTADSIYRIQYDASAVQSVAIGTVTGLATSSLTIAMMMYVTFRLDWQLGLVAITVAPFLYLLSHLFRRRYRGRYREVKRLESSALAVVQEVLTSVRVVKAFGQEIREQDRFIHRSRDGMRARLRLAVAEVGLGALTALVTAGGTAAVLYIGVRHVQRGSLSLGHLLLVMTYLAQLYSPLKTLSKKINSLQGSLASAERAFELLDHAPEVAQAAEPRPLARAEGDIELEDVWFGYGDDPVLKGVTLSIPRGSRVGIAGKTGAGKSTLVSLLPRFYEPTSGRILLDGSDLRDYSVADLRAQFAIVLQETLLFSTSIAENIRYGRPQATFDEIVAAAEAANAHGFIEALPDGYDTLVGERGMKLAGGERQRIALARAFLKDAPILILDEPTSSVDVKTEAVIMDAIRRLMVGRTTLMIAHRLGTLDICDVRIELEDGRVVPAGSLPEPPTQPTGNGAVAGPSPDHPAALAWRSLRPGLPLPTKIEMLKERRTGKRTAVYRLQGAGSGGSDVIAKRSPRRISQVEKTVHERILPISGLPGFAFHGFVEEPEGTDCWLFTSDLEGERYDPRQSDHQQLAGRWLGLLHTSTADLADQISLPDRGTLYHLEQLRQVIATIGTALDASSTRPADRALLAELDRLLRRAARHGPEVEDLGEGVATVLVHGDFARKNLRLGRANGVPRLLAFDWEMAGWGKPMIDLARSPFGFRTLGAAPDLDAYHAVVSARWPELTLQRIRRLSELGSIFRCVASISWAAAHLDHEWEASIADLRFYTRVLGKLTEGWGALQRGDGVARDAAPGPSSSVTSSWSIVHQKRLGDRVWRLTLGGASPRTTVIAKCLSPDVASRVEMLATRWLPAVDMSDSGPALLRVEPAPAGVVWHVYEDVGDWALDPTLANDERIAALIRLTVRLHLRFASHPMLEEIRRQARDLGPEAHESTLVAAARKLQSVRARTRQESALLDRLLSRFVAFLDEAPERVAMLRALGGPDTLLHGDLWPQNCLVIPEPSGLRARLVDWDRMGVGNAVYDLSTLLSRLPAERRVQALALYRDEAGLRTSSSAEELNLMAQTCERTRLAEWTRWRAAAVDTPDADWAWDELARLEPWLDVQPLLPTAPQSR